MFKKLLMMTSLVSLLGMSMAQADCIPTYQDEVQRLNDTYGLDNHSVAMDNVGAGMMVTSAVIAYKWTKAAAANHRYFYMVDPSVAAAIGAGIITLVALDRIEMSGVIQDRDDLNDALSVLRQSELGIGTHLEGLTLMLQNEGYDVTTMEVADTVVDLNNKQAFCVVPEKLAKVPAIKDMVAKSIQNSDR